MRTPILALACALALAAPARAQLPTAPLAPGLPAPGTRTYVDGGQVVQVVPSTRTPAEGRRAVRLVYESGRFTEAQVDATAIVQAADVHAAAKRFGFDFLKTLMPGESLHLVRARGTEDGVDLAGRLAAADGITQAVPNLYLRHVTYAEPVVPDDTYFLGQWFFDDIGISKAWGYAQGDPATTIAVVDTGCNRNHPDLESKLLDGYDAIDDDDDPSIPPDSLTIEGASHGTSCSGLAAAATNNSKGVAGACANCTLRCVRLLPIPNKEVSLGTDVAAFSFVIDSGAAVSSNSWGYESYVRAPGPLVTAIRSVLTKGRGGLGTVVVFASGNENRETYADEPAGLPGVISVGVVTHYQEVTTYSNWGAPLDVVAPLGTLTTDLAGASGDAPGDYTGNFSGTSSACPIVAGVAGLIVSARPDMTAAEVTDTLIHTARQVPYARPDEDGHDPNYGYGLVDPTAALKNALGIVDPDPVDAGTPDAGPDPLEGITFGGGGVASGCGCDGGATGSLALLGLALFLRRRRA